MKIDDRMKLLFSTILNVILIGMVAIAFTNYEYNSNILELKDKALDFCIEYMEIVSERLEVSDNQTYNGSGFVIDYNREGSHE